MGCFKRSSRRAGAICSLGLPAKAQNGLKNFMAVMNEAKEKFQREPLSEALQWLVKTIEYEKAIHEEVKSRQMRHFKTENVQEFIQSLAEFERQGALDGALEKEGDFSLSSFVAGMALNNQMAQANSRQNKGDSVHLLTFHSAKGLEFPACFLVGLEDHIIPHEKSMKETGVEEERRLMYVAVTRAKSYLTLSMAKQRSRMGKVCTSLPSRFLFEIPKELIKVTDWRDV